MKKISIDQAIRWALIYKRPIEGKSAYRIWEWLSGNNSPFPHSYSGQIYHTLGYKSFQGYPLKRS